MKKLLVLLDGMDDEPIDSLGGYTPREAASMPGLDFMCRHGNSYLMKTIPPGNSSSTDVAVLNILGYPVSPKFSGRTWLEAIGSGVDIDQEDLCLRCNLIWIENNRIVSHSADNISDDEAKVIIDNLNDIFGSPNIRFHTGKGYRNILTIRDCDSEVMATPVHELLGSDVKALCVESTDIKLQRTLNNIITQSANLLSNMSYKANGIALWAPGRKPARPFCNIEGAVIAGVNLVKGIGKAFGMEIVKVEGVTGDCNTNFSGKLHGAIEALATHDFVILHIEAPDEASHNKNPREKVEVLETIDRQILSPLLEKNLDIEITVQADHATSSLTGKHLNSPVKVVTYRCISSALNTPDVKRRYGVNSAINAD